MKANHKQNAVKLTANKMEWNRAQANLTVLSNRRQTEEITYVAELTATVQFSTVHEVEY